jgi:hypothetical protein
MKFFSSEHARPGSNRLAIPRDFRFFSAEFNTVDSSGVQFGKFAGLSTAKDMLTGEVTAALMALELVRG